MSTQVAPHDFVSPQELELLKDDDRRALRTVSLILLAIVTCGTLLMTVFMAMCL